MSWLKRAARALTADTPDGTYVEMRGTVRALEGEETIVPPVYDRECVVARIKFDLRPNPRQRTPTTKFERFHNRPFVVERGAMRVIVDSAHLELDVVTRSEAATTESCVPVGAHVVVRGTLMRDGVTRPTDAVGFRDAPPVLKLVGSEDVPVVITASVSDSDSR